MNEQYISASYEALKNLKQLHRRQSDRLEELRDYEDIILKYSRVKNKQYYYSKRLGDVSFKYLGADSNIDVIRTKERRYLQRLVAELEGEIANIEHFLKEHRDLDYESINAGLPLVYRDRHMDRKSEALSDATLTNSADAWKLAKEREKASFVPRAPERLVMKAIDGTPMRSKSEVIIANLFIANGIPYVYELPHVIGDVTIHTDFTALSTADFKTEILIEHEGLMNNSNYQQQFLYKVNTYLSADIVPGRDIFFTFDDLHGGFDPSPVQDIIDTRLKPRP